MKFAIRHKLTKETLYENDSDNETGKVIFECELDDKVIKSSYARLLGLAIKVAVDNKVDLTDADLRFADLRGIDLCGANFNGADFSCANLRGTNLRDASFIDANFQKVDLRFSDAQGAIFK
jgi:uncharacterized protein YjbI with pentapeptide repeats